MRLKLCLSNHLFMPIVPYEISSRNYSVTFKRYIHNIMNLGFAEKQVYDYCAQMRKERRNSQTIKYLTSKADLNFEMNFRSNCKIDTVAT